MLDTHKNWSGLAEKVHAKLKEMYRVTGQTEKFGDMLKTMVVAQSRMDFYKEYKDFVPKQQWKVALVELLNSITKWDFRMDVLAYENMTDELYASKISLSPLPTFAILGTLHPSASFHRKE